MRLLVTGGAGFIGSNFIRHWLGRHEADDVVNVDLLTYAGDATNLADVQARHPLRYSFVRGDIAEAATVAEVFASVRPQVVVHFAAESDNSRAVLDPLEFVRTNMLDTRLLLDAAWTVGVERFHHVSTCEVRESGAR